MKNRYRIGEAASLFDISPDLVRHYEDIGLVDADRATANGYRQYSFEDLIKLNYVRVLRDLELGLDDIAELVERRDLEGQSLKLDEYQREIEDRIRRLLGVSRDLESYRQAIDAVRRSLGGFEITESPRLVCCVPDDSGNDPFMTRLKRCFSEDSDIVGVSYSMLIPRQYFRSGSDEGSFLPMCTGVLPESSHDELPERCSLFHSKRCLRYIFGSRVRITTQDLAPLLTYLGANGLKVSGDGVCRYQAFEKTDEGFVDYVAAWIPIE